MTKKILSHLLEFFTLCELGLKKKYIKNYVIAVFIISNVYFIALRKMFHIIIELLFFFIRLK